MKPKRHPKRACNGKAKDVAWFPTKIPSRWDFLFQLTPALQSFTEEKVV